MIGDTTKVTDIQSLASRLQAHGISQEAWADAAGVSRGTIQRLLSGNGRVLYCNYVACLLAAGDMLAEVQDA